MGKMTALLLPKSILSVIRITTGWSVWTSQMNDRHVRVIQVAIHSYFKLNWHWGKCSVPNSVSHTLGIYNWFPWRSHTCITKPRIWSKPFLTCIWQWNLPSIPEKEYSCRHPKRWDHIPKDETPSQSSYRSSFLSYYVRKGKGNGLWVSVHILCTPLLAVVFPDICLSLLIHLNGMKKHSACNCKSFT